MLLCLRHGYWYIAARYDEADPTCTLLVGPQMLREEGFREPPVGDQLGAGVIDLSGIRFYPRLSLDGMRVFPECWSSDSAEPVLRVWSGQEHFERPVRTTQEYLARISDLRAKGWEWDEREGGTRWVHVDELDKLEGPPPVGVF